MKTILLITLLLTLLAPPKSGYTLLSPIDFYEGILEDSTGILLDVRLYEDYKEMRIKSAVWAGEKVVLIEILKDVGKEQNIYLYCYEGRARGKAVIDILLEKEYKNIFFLKGGFNGWVKKGFETDKTKISKLSLSGDRGKKR